ncbi:MAG: class I SAM-dependent methyltransferase [Candidatus Baldrarchaeia archaeon]
MEAFRFYLKEVTRAREVYGLEISSEAVKSCKRKGVTAICMDIESGDFPFEDNYFDAVYAGAIIEHLFSPDHLLNETYRLLKPGGVAIVSTANLASWHSRLHLLLGYQPYPVSIHSIKARYRIGSFLHPSFRGHGYLDCGGHEGRGHVQFFTLRALKELCELHGFKCEKVFGSPDVITFALPLGLHNIVQLIDNAISSKIPGLASHIGVVLRKRDVADAY